MLTAPEPSRNHTQRVQADVLALFLANWRGSLFALVVVTAGVIMAVREHVPLQFWAAWGACAGFNTLAQAGICLAMERATSTTEAARLWLPWLLINLMVNSSIWGLVPWMVSGVSVLALSAACLFNAMVLFIVANTPSTAAMQLCAGLPIGVLCTAALLRHGAPFYAGLGYPILVAVILFYGVRLNAARAKGFEARYTAEALTVAMRAQQERLVAYEQERTLLLERQRLTRDMHDGLGSSLVASLAAVERGEVQPERFASMLRDSIDDLRTVIDSLDPIDHDLVAVLASLRFRLEDRLVSAGIRLEWTMHDLPELKWMSSPEALHVMRIVQEVLANVIKHASASHLHLMATQQGSELEIRIDDNGKGFDPVTTVPGRGMKSLRNRTSELGGRLDIQAAHPQGTSVRLRLPIERSSEPRI